MVTTLAPSLDHTDIVSSCMRWPFLETVLVTVLAPGDRYDPKPNPNPLVAALAHGDIYELLDAVESQNLVCDVVDCSGRAETTPCRHFHDFVDLAKTNLIEIWRCTGSFS